MCFLLASCPSQSATQNAIQSVRVQKLTRKKRRHPNTGVVPHLSLQLFRARNLHDDRDSTRMPRDPNNHKRMEMKTIGLSDIVFCISSMIRNTATKHTPHQKAKIIDFELPVDQLSPLHRKAKNPHRPHLEETHPPLGFVPL
jgi:hypothetical protein